MKKRILIPGITIILLLILGPISASTQSHAVYYLSPEGNDLWPGTFDQPWASLAHAVDQIGAGDTLYIRGGNYTLTDGLYIDPWPAGTAAAWIQIKAYADETPIFDCSTPDNTTCITLGGDYMLIEGLEIKNATRTGLTVWEASHIKVLNNTIHHTQKGGIWIGAETWGEVDDILVEGNTIYQTCQINNPPPLSGQGGGWPGAVGSSYVTNMTIRNNLVYENFGEGIAFTLVDSSLAENNTVHDNYSVNMYMDNATNSIFRNNFTYTTYITDFYRFNEPATNIQMANEGIYDSTNPLDQNQVINNIMMGGRYGFHYGNYENGGGLKNTLMANNTLYHSAWALIKIDEDAGHSSSTIANNIFYQEGSAPVVDFAPTDSIDWHHNLWYGGNSGNAAGEGDIHADPLLIQAGGTTPNAYQIQNTSSAKDAGDPAMLSYVGNDFSGSIRPQGETIDIGAFEVSDLLFFITLIIDP